MEKIQKEGYEMLGISNRVIELADECEQELQLRFEQIDDVSLYNTAKILKAFKNE